VVEMQDVGEEDVGLLGVKLSGAFSKGGASAFEDEGGDREG
jgi:hypothetical protein